MVDLTRTINNLQQKGYETVLTIAANESFSSGQSEIIKISSNTNLVDPHLTHHIINSSPNTYQPGVNIT